jgi:hypothetical protein
MSRPLRLLTFTAAVFGAACMLALPGVYLPWLRIFVGLPLVFVLPGYSLVVAADPQALLGRAERATFAVGGSLALATLSGLLLGAVGVRLTEATWLVWLGGFTLICALVADGRVRHAAPERGGARAPIAASVAVACFALAVVALTHTLPLRSASGEVLQLWLLPKRASTSAVQVGVANLHSATPYYHLEVTEGDRVLLDTSLTLPDGATRTFTITRSSQTVPVRASLSTLFGETPVRRTWLLPATAASGR